MVHGGPADELLKYIIMVITVIIQFIVRIGREYLNFGDFVRASSPT